MRKDIVNEIIEKTPGISYNEIARKSGLSNGVISHHLIKLMENGNVEKEGTIRGKYFLKNVPKKDRVKITILRNKTNNEIFKILMKGFNNGEIITQNEISKKIKKSASTISISLKDLHKNGIVERVIMNKSVNLSNDIGYRIANGKLSTRDMIKYNL